MGEFDFDVVSDMDELLRLRELRKLEKLDGTAGEEALVPPPETSDATRME
jgi:hypothetical protein